MEESNSKENIDSIQIGSSEVSLDFRQIFSITVINQSFMQIHPMAIGSSNSTTVTHLPAIDENEESSHVQMYNNGNLKVPVQDYREIGTGSANAKAKVRSTNDNLRTNSGLEARFVGN